MKKHISAQNTENQQLSVLSYRWVTDINPTLRDSGNTLEEKVERSTSQRTQRWALRYCSMDTTCLLYLWHPKSCGYLHKTCAKINPIRIPTWRWQRLLRPHPSLRSCWLLMAVRRKMKNLFPLRVWPVVGFLYPGGWPHACEHMGSINWIQWVKNKWINDRRSPRSFKGDTRRGLAKRWKGRYNQDILHLCT